jgi:transcription elongation factor Elf1
MVQTVRCYKCGTESVRLITGGRKIIHAHCDACDTNLLEEVSEFQQQVEQGGALGEGSEDTDPTDLAPFG